MAGCYTRWVYVITSKVEWHPPLGLPGGRSEPKEAQVWSAEAQHTAENLLRLPIKGFYISLPESYPQGDPTQDHWDDKATHSGQRRAIS